jgi:hypothetical protein
MYRLPMLGSMETIILVKMVEDVTIFHLIVFQSTLDAQNTKNVSASAGGMP